MTAGIPVRVLETGQEFPSVSAALTLPGLKAWGFSLHRETYVFTLRELLLGVPPRCSGKIYPTPPLARQVPPHSGARLCLCSGRADSIRIKAALEGRGLYPRFLVRALTGRRFGGSEWFLFTQGRAIGGVHLMPLNDPYWELDLEWRKRQRPVRCTTTGTVYPSLSAAARSIDVHAYTLCRAIRRGRPCGDLSWEYADA